MKTKSEDASVCSFSFKIFYVRKPSRAITRSVSVLRDRKTLGQRLGQKMRQDLDEREWGGMGDWGKVECGERQTDRG